jgi:hypothetical protein
MAEAVLLSKTDFFSTLSKPHANPEEQGKAHAEARTKTKTKADPPPAAKDDN